MKNPKKVQEVPLEKVGLLTVSGAAAALGASEKAVQNYATRGLLPVVIVGRRFLFRLADVKRFELPARGRPAKDT